MRTLIFGTLAVSASALFSAHMAFSMAQESQTPKVVAAAQQADSEGPDMRVKGLVTISHIDEERWRFEYDLSRDVRSIMLGPKTEQYHATSWKLPADFHVTGGEGIYSYLERRDGKSFKRVSVDVRTYGSMVKYAPQPFAVFDGGTAVNTGPLGFAASIGPSRAMIEFDPVYSFVGVVDETIIIPGQERGAVTRIDIPSNGLFAYFGTVNGLRETEHVLSILDDDFPKAFADDFVSSVEALALLYDRQLRDALPGKLVIMVSYQEAPAIGFGGGAQNFQIMAKAMGPEALSADRDDVRKMRLFFAHEMAHIWQASLGTDSARWFGEGEAELLALRSLERLGKMTAEEVATNLTERVAKCVKSLHQTNLVESHLKGQPQANYTGGALVLAAAVAATRADGKLDDIFALDRAVGALDLDLRMSRPIEAFQTAVRTLGGTQEAADAIGSFIQDRHDDPLLALRSLFDATDLAYRADGDALHIEPSMTKKE